MEVYKSDIIMQQLHAAELTSLESDFIQYKSTGDTPESFGRDVPYDHPNTLPILQAGEVYHLHLADPEKPWLHRKMQYYRTSDTHLVYCQAILKDHCYLLIAILKPNAHEQARSNNIMHKIGLVAEKFRLQF